jgi:hypothetical protein
MMRIVHRASKKLSERQIGHQAGIPRARTYGSLEKLLATLRISDCE